jgi:thiamine transport system permease protein
MRRPGTEVVLLAAVAATVAAFAVAPAALLFGRGVASGGGTAALATALGARANRLAFDNSLLQGGISGALAMAVGYPAGVFLGRYAWPGRGIARSAMLLAFLLPTLVMVVGVLDLFGPSGLLGGPIGPLRWFASGVPGVVAVNLFYNVPIVVVLTATGCEASSPALEEAVASLGGSPARAYVESWAAPSWVGAACGGLLTFVLSALSFAPPILLCGGTRCDTVEVRVYALAEVAGEPYVAGVLALVLVAAFLVPAVAYVVLSRGLRPARGREYRSRRLPWRAASTWALAAAFGAVVVAELALVAAVLYRSVLPPGAAVPGAAWRALFASSTGARIGVSVAGAVGNTLFFAALAAAVGFVVATAAAFVAARRPSLATPLALVLFVPVLLSPVVLAVALSTVWLASLGGSANVWLLVVLSQALLAVPFALQGLEIPLAGVPRADAEAAETLGATSWGAFVDVELPRVRRGVRTAVLFAFALGLGEFTATYFLVSSTAGFRTLPVAVYDLESARLSGVADAATGLLLLLSLAVFAAIVVTGGRDDAVR